MTTIICKHQLKSVDSPSAKISLAYN